MLSESFGWFLIRFFVQIKVHVFVKIMYNFYMYYIGMYTGTIDFVVEYCSYMQIFGIFKVNLCETISRYFHSVNC